MKRFILLVVTLAFLTIPSWTQDKSHNPTWWNKYQHLSQSGALSSSGSVSSVTAGANVDVSNECAPQSETYIALRTAKPQFLAGGANEIYRLPMRGFYSSNGGSNWGGVDLPLPPPLSGTNDTRFGSDPSLAFDTRNNLFYSYIVVFFSNGAGINGTEMAVAHSTDGGQTYPGVTYFSFQGGGSKFNDKPMITTDTNAASPFRDNVYVSWDAASGGSAAGGIRFATSTDHGATFSTTRADDPSGPGQSIAAVPFVGPDGAAYDVWNDIATNAITFNRSANAGAAWGTPSIISYKTAAFDVGIPAESYRRALVYPACDADRSSGAYRGRLYCSWMDLTNTGTTDIFLSHSEDKGATWSAPVSVGDSTTFLVDRFNQWLAVDAITGDVNISFYDTRNDTTGQRYMTDQYLSRSSDGGATFQPNVRVTSVSSNEHDCAGLFPCSAGINYGNQQGDYEGLVSFNGVSHPIWTDSRNQLQPVAGCKYNAMEEVFSATVK